MPCRSRNWPWQTVLSFIAISVNAIRIGVELCNTNVDELRKDLHIMGDKLNAAAADLEADIQAVADMVSAKDARIAALEAERDAAVAALATADADKAAAVAAQASADDDEAAGVISHGDEALERLLNPAPVEGGGDVPADGGETPVEGGDAPVEGGDAPVEAPVEGGDVEAPASE